MSKNRGRSIRRANNPNASFFLVKFKPFYAEKIDHFIITQSFNNDFHRDC